MTGVNRALRLVVLALMTLLLVPTAGVRPGTISLHRAETAKGVDFSDGRLWVLVLGSDADGRTDAIQLVGLDSSGRAVGLGIPRDAYLDLPGELGSNRINIAYADPEGGPKVVAQAVEGLTGIAPELVLEVDFAGYLDLMDLLGEVEVRTPEEFTNDGVRVRQGLNTFDATESLAYVRFRRTLDNYDFDRSANQQRVMLAALRRLRAEEDRPGFMERATLAALDAVETDLPPTELYRLAQFLTTVDPRRVDTCVLPGTPYTVPETGASVVRIDEGEALRLGADARQFRLRTCPQP